MSNEATSAETRAPMTSGPPSICLTDTGLAAIRSAAPAHVAHVRELFLSALTPAQARGMREAADAVLDNIERHTAGDTDAEL